MGSGVSSSMDAELIREFRDKGRDEYDYHAHLSEDQKMSKLAEKYREMVVQRFKKETIPIPIKKDRSAIASTISASNKRVSKSGKQSGSQKGLSISTKSQKTSAKENQNNGVLLSQNSKSLIDTSPKPIPNQSASVKKKDECYKCPVCVQNFATKGRLNTHIRFSPIHAQNVKTYLCIPLGSEDKALESDQDLSPSHMDWNIMFTGADPDYGLRGEGNGSNHKMIFKGHRTVSHELYMS
jgi:hypothetical protein